MKNLVLATSLTLVLSFVPKAAHAAEYASSGSNLLVHVHPAISDTLTPAQMGQLAWDYCYGENGKPQNDDEAFKWAQRAAAKEDVKGMFIYGRCYHVGQGVQQSYAEAVLWYRKAAEQGFTPAQNNLGVCYINGQGVQQSYAEAVKWYRKAAEQGDADAQNNLGGCYQYGQGITMDIQKALYWYKKAMGKGNTNAIANIGFMYEMGIGVEKNQTKAFQLYKQAAEKGNGFAQRMLAFAYYSAIGTKKDNDLAVYWMRRAKESGDEVADETLEFLQNEIYGSSVSDRKTTIIMNKVNSVYYVPCKINGLSADFIFDTGAGMITLSLDFARRLYSLGLLTGEDVTGDQNMLDANGTISNLISVNLKDVEISGLHLRNVAAVIVENQNAPLLLGQSAIQKLGRITIDGHKLIIHND